jgi:hypothetical protein
VPNSPNLSSNGILARVPGERIAEGSQQLPAPGPDQQAEPLRKVIVPDVRDLGPVSITYELNTYRHGKSRHWHWVAVHAEVIA